MRDMVGGWTTLGLGQFAEGHGAALEGRHCGQDRRRDAGFGLLPEAARQPHEPESEASDRGVIQLRGCAGLLHTLSLTD